MGRGSAWYRPRPLHHQLLLDRKILVTEQMDMHLVWTEDRMFLKPIPRFLLEPHFWNNYLSCEKHCLCSSAEVVGTRHDSGSCERRKLWKSALGFLFSHAALIRHESDFLIAQQNHLLPAEVEWPAWRLFVQQLDTEHIYQQIDARFVFGELRLSRLDKIYFLSCLGSYKPHWNQYGRFFHDNFATLASVTVYMAIVLTAMQLGLSTKPLVDNDAFQMASYGFAVFAILAPIAIAGCIFLAFWYALVYNVAITLRYRTKRARHIHVPTGSGGPWTAP